MDEIELETIEMNLLLEAVYQRSGYDFRDYAKAHLRRRLRHRMSVSGCASFAEMQHRVLHSPEFLVDLLFDLSITTTEMFRDPEFYRAFRERVVTLLDTYPSVKIWHAGCSTGEEVYSIAILLNEAGIYGKCRIYATDMNERALDGASRGIFPIDRMQEYTRNYQQAGGKLHFSDYYTADYGSAMFDQQLKENMVFSRHNLVTDHAFGEMNVVLCRNVMIYFDKPLKARVLALFRDSLVRKGFLCLGSRESLKFSEVEKDFDTVDSRAKIFQKVS